MPHDFKTRLVSNISNAIQSTKYLGRALQSGTIDQLPNPKWEDFEEAGIRRNEALVNNSVTHSLIRPNKEDPRKIGPGTGVYGSLDTNYYNRVYAPLDGSKANRIYEYRTMAAYPTVQDAITKFANNFINTDERGECIHFNYADQDANIDIVKALTENFQTFVRIFDFPNRGAKYCSDYIIEGEVFFELLINNERPENKRKGILGILKLPTDLMDVVYKDKYNDVVRVFIGQEIAEDDWNRPTRVVRTRPVFLQPNQIFYVNSGERDPLNEYIVPFINRARKRYIQLSFLEDAIVIYRLARAPERLVITADCGNMSQPEAEAHLQRLRQQMYKNLNFDPNNGDVTQRYAPMSMMDSFFFAKTSGNEGVNITTLPGGQNLGQLDDLNYFKKALYESLCVPTSYLNKDQSQANADNAMILQEELAFADQVIAFQKRWAAAVKQAWITHLKCMGLYEEYEVRENMIDIWFEPPTNYYRHRKLQGIQIAGSAFSALASNEVFSKAYLMKHVMNMSESDIIAQYTLRKKEATHEFEITQIQNSGPNWKAQMLSDLTGGMAGGGEGGGMGGGMGGGGGFGSEMGGAPPEMGMGGEGGEIGGEMGGEGGAPEGPPAENGPV